MPAASSDQNAYDTGPSATVQANFDRAASALVALIDRRTGDVKSAMADYYADGASEEYGAKEQRWTTAADGVKDVVRLLRGSLEGTDGIAGHAGKMAQNAVHEI